MLTMYTVVGFCGLLLFLAGFLAYGCHCLMMDRVKMRDRVRSAKDVLSLHRFWSSETTPDWSRSS